MAYPIEDYIDVLRCQAELKVVATAFGAVFLSAVNFLDEAIICLFMLMVLDFVIGFCRGCRERAISSTKLKRGALKFVWYGLTLAAGMFFDYAILSASGKLSEWMVFRVTDLLILYLLFTEMLSILEHAAALGVNVPRSLIEKLEKCRRKEDEDK
jgi:toxin secretion/phage lysis holin